MQSTFFLILFSLLSLISLQAQDEDYEKTYEQRIQREYLYSVYIPKDLADAMVQLTKLTTVESRNKFKAATELDASRKLHFSLGRWIIRNWGFYGGSRLSHYLKKLGLSHPDDMARFIIIMYHRKLNDRPLDPKPVLDELIQHRQQEWEQRLVRDTIAIRQRAKE